MAKCLRCGFPNSSLANFCGGCGHSLHASMQNPAVTYTSGESIPQELRDNILRSRAIVEGARRHVTVMFADIRASFEFVENNDPETVREILDAVISIMVEKIHQYEGTVAQVLGDGVMALFGAPIAQEDHAERACYAAIAMHKKMASRKDWPGRELGITPQIRVGLNSGSVVVGTIGNDLSLDYRAVGSTTHMAARMEQIALPGTTRLTGETLGLAAGLIHTRSLGLCLIKGLSHPIETFELTDSTSLTRFQALMSRGLSPFYGRASELQKLQGLVKVVQQGNKRSFHLTGEPGIGKSRLAFEFLVQPSTLQCSILQINGLAYEQAPYAVLRKLLVLKLENTLLDSSATTRDKLRSILTTDEDLVRHMPALESLLGIESEEREWRHLDPSHRRQQMFEAFRVVLECLSNERPLVLLCEDLHWFDSESLAFLTDLNTKPSTNGLLLFLTSRSDWKYPGAGPGLVVDLELALDPLTSETADDLVVSLMGNDASSTALRGKITRHTYGNPLFIEEIVRSMSESGTLIGEAGDYQLADSTATIEVPPSVESVITARIDRLPPELKELLICASVIGDEITRNLLCSLLGVTEDVLEQRLIQVEEIGMFTLQRSSPVAVYQFRHTLTRDIFHRGLLRSTRVDLHARIVTALESVYRDRLTEKADKLALHAHAGELWRKSAEYHLIACTRAVSRSANRYATEALGKGLISLEQHAVDETSMILGLDIRIAGFTALLTLGENERLLQLVGEAKILAESIGDQHKLGTVYCRLATALWLSSEYDLAFDATTQALVIAGNENHIVLKMEASHTLGMVHHARGNFAQASRLYTQLLAGIEKKHESFLSVFFRTFMASSLAFMGDFKMALRLFAEGVSIADTVKHPYAQTMIREEMGFCYLVMGDPAAAIKVLEEATEICYEYDVVTMKPALAGRLAHAFSEVGRIEEAIALVDSAFDEETFRRGGRYALIYLLLAQSNVQLRAGFPEDAISSAKEVEKLTGASGEQAFNAYALLALGNAYSACEELNVLFAEAAFLQARSVATQKDMKPLMAQCCLSLGRLLTVSGRREQAEAELIEASRRFRELKLNHLAQQASEVLPD